MRIKYGVFCAVLATGGWVLQATAQPPAASQPAPMTIHVTVTDKAGNPVSGLRASDFTVLDDNHSTPIQSFSTSESTPPLVVVVMDQVNEPFRALSIEQKELETFFAGNGGHLPFPVAMMFLTDSGLQQVKPTTNGTALAALLAKHTADLRVINSTNDIYNSEARFQTSLQAFESIVNYEAGYPGRKLLIWMSQGWPTMDMPDMSMLSVKQQKNIFSLVVTASNLLRFTNTTVYSVDPEGNYDVASMHSVEWQQYQKPVSRFDHAQYGNLAVQVLAERSGGLVRYGGNDTAQALTQCVQDASGGYDLTFQPQASDKPDTWHSIHVKVDQHGDTVRALDGYYAQP
jgi:VWFA-related protein